VPFVPGSEVAGTVSALGPGVSGWSVGDRVLVFCGFGGFAGQVVAPALSLVAVPASVDLPRAAALLQSYCTMLFTLTRRTSVRPGEWVLVLGAGGGIGLAAVDVAVALGARVVAAASTPDKLEAAVAMGAEATIAYEEEDLKVRARELSGGGVDVVVDPVGGRHAEPALRATRQLGRFCVIGFASGPIPTVPLNQVLLNNRTVVGVDWGGWTFTDPLGNRALIDEVMGMVADGRLRPTAPATRSLDEAAAVMAGLIDRTVGGKVVLVP
jgi:NADPH2:quinone reductase